MCKKAKQASVAYTDGSVYAGRGAGGWAVVFVRRQKKLCEIAEPSDGIVSSARMELRAMVEAVERTEGQLILRVDCSYLVDSVRKRWPRRWRRQGWRRSTGEPAKHADLWKRYLAARHGRQITIQYIRGERQQELHHRAHVLANKQLTNVPGAHFEQCPECGSGLAIRTNSYTGERFFSCGEYPECTYSRDMAA